MDNNNVLGSFWLNYAPLRIKGFTAEPRKPEDFPELTPPQRVLAAKLDEKRLEDPNVPIALAANDIIQGTLKALGGNNVSGALMTAALAAVGGRELMRGIIGAVKSLDGDTMKNAGALSVFIADTKSGEKYLFGDMVGNEFCGFYMTAAADPESPVETLKPIAAKTAETVGSGAYWETPFNGAVGRSPKELADELDGKFDRIFAVYCRYPQERMLAFAAEYGWRTSHYIGMEL